eukprot:SAG31_NODE_6956_length_1835_cov_1.283986_2_plen_318_part_01
MQKCPTAPRQSVRLTLPGPSTLTRQAGSFLAATPIPLGVIPLGVSAGFSVNWWHVYNYLTPSNLSRNLTGPLQASLGHVLCEDDWGGELCTLDVAAPTLACEDGIVSVQVSGERGIHVLTSADIPLPAVGQTGPDFGGNITIELTSPTEGSGMTSWTQMETPSSFSWETATEVQDTFNVSVTIATAINSEDVADDATTRVQFRVTDAFGNTDVCTLRVHVADFDECADNTHTCDATALCVDLFDRRGVPDEGSDHIVTGTYECTCPDGTEGDGYSTCSPTRNQHILVVGGYNDEDGVLATAEIYDPEGNTVHQVNSRE